MTNNKLTKITVIVGPTASGKSDWALRLALWLRSRRITKQFGIKGAEIISADSRQVYRGMDIGTGKVLRDKTFPVPNLKFKNQNAKFRDFYSAGIRHHLINVSSPREQFTANDFKKLGEKAIRDIVARDKIPIIVGGTGFYIDVLLGRMAIAEVPPNKKLRKRFDKFNAEHLFKMLRKLNPQKAKTIDRHNKRRLVRALEIAIYLKTHKNPKLYLIHDRNINTNLKILKTLWIGINPGKEKLAKNIKTRLDKRLEQKMIGEVQKLHKERVSWKRLDDFGLEYRWISRWLKKPKLKIPNSKFLNSDEYQNLLQDIIKYSKRQMTWFEKNKKIHWIKDAKTAERLVRRFLG